MLKHDQLVVVRDKNDGLFHRARIIASEHDEYSKEFKHGTVCFIDYGHTQKCEPKDLYVFLVNDGMATMPARCFQCRLAEIQPSTVNLSGGNMWDQRAIEQFKQCLWNHRLTIEVSVCCGSKKTKKD